MKFILELKTSTGDTCCVECRIDAKSEKSDNQTTDEVFVAVVFLRNEIIFPINFCMSEIVCNFAQSTEGMVSWQFSPKIRLRCFFICR